MRELIRLHNARTGMDAGRALEGYSLTVFAGEIVCVVGISGSGKTALEKVLTGQMALSGGALFIGGVRAVAYGAADAFEKGIYAIGIVNPMAPNMTIADNMEAIRHVRNPFRPYNRRRAEQATARILAAHRIGKQPRARVDELSFLQQQTLSIAKVVNNGARLVLINCVHNTYSARDAVELGAMMRRLKDAGVSFLIISERPNAFFDVADKVQIVHKGVDLHQWQRGTFDVQALYRTWEQSAAPMDAGEDQRWANALYLLDFHWSSKEPVVTYLQALRRHNPQMWARHIALDVPQPGVYCDGSTAIVPYDSAIKLLTNMSIGDNLIACIAKRAGVGWLRIVHRGMRQVLVQAFCALAGVSDPATPVALLSEVQRKMLSIQRWALAKPKTIVLENPYWGLDVGEVERLNAYLDQLMRGGIRLIFYVKQLDDVAHRGGTVISAYGGMRAKLL